MFKWACLIAGLAFGCVIVTLLFSLSSKADLALTQSNEALATVNDNLPEMVGEVRKITHTLSVLSDDVNALKRLSGIESQAREEGLVGHADAILELLQQQGSGSVLVGVKKTFGSGLKDLVPLEEFIVGARREASILVFRAKSRQEVLHRLTHSWSRKPFWLQFDGGEAIELEAWVRENHPESADLPVFEP